MHWEQRTLWRPAVEAVTFMASRQGQRYWMMRASSRLEGEGWLPGRQEVYDNLGSVELHQVVSDHLWHVLDL
jgi:hypothetical protein